MTSNSPRIHQGYSVIDVIAIKYSSPPPSPQDIFVFFDQMGKECRHTVCKLSRQMEYTISYSSVQVCHCLPFSPKSFYFIFKGGGRKIGRIRSGCRIDVMGIQGRQARKLELVGMRSARRKHPPPPFFLFTYGIA